jgi:anti-sigma28 factor (negative regulator of flagellin synthesis)
MVNFATSALGSIPPSANEVVLEAPACSAHEARRHRIQQLREAIEGGQYRVAAGDLADAILRVSRQAN